MVTKDDIFIALGREEGIGNGFETQGANIQHGIFAEGTRIGAWAQSAAPYTGTAPILIERIGVFARGDNWGVYGMTDNVGPNSGVVGEPRFAGVFGTSDTEFGIVGTSNVSSGVFGQAGDAAAPVGPAGVSGSSRQHFGVLGVSSENVAVRGEAQSAVGIYGRSAQSTGVRGDGGGAGPVFNGGKAGVFGTSVDSPGVIGTSTRSWGIVGQSGAPGPLSQNAGVLGTAAASFGVAGTSQAYPGIFGTSTNSFGIIAISGAAGPLFGVPFTSPAAMFATSDKGTGVAGTSTATYGVFGFSTRSDGVRGVSLGQPVAGTLQVPTGVSGSSDAGFGVSGTTKTGTGVAGVATAGGLAGAFIGDVHVGGNLTVTGTKSAVVPFPDGSRRRLYCVESPDCWFEDFGSARLKRGRATVKLDADFARVVTLDGYRVFLTPEGDCRGLYVRSKRRVSFDVSELQGGTSNVAFSYRLVAKRKDIKGHTRFAKIDVPAVPLPVGKARAAGGRKSPRLPSPMRALLATLEKETRKKAP